MEFYLNCVIIFQKNNMSVYYALFYSHMTYGSLVLSLTTQKKPGSCLQITKKSIRIINRVGTDFRQSNFQTELILFFQNLNLKRKCFFSDRLVERSIIVQTIETIEHPFSHGTFQSHGYGFTSHLFHVVVKNRAKWNVKNRFIEPFLFLIKYRVV